MMQRRNFVGGAIAAAMGSFISTAGAQDAWPAKPLRLIVPFAAGSTPDLVARTVAERIQATSGQPVVVENRTGAAGMIGTAFVSKAVPDGYTLGVGSVGPMINNPLLFASMPYDPVKDIQPITKAVVLPSVLVVRTEFPASNMTEFIAEVKRNPGKYSYASVGNGSLAHLTMALLAQRSALELNHLPYAGGPQMMSAIVGGHVDMTIMPMQTVKTMVDDKRLKVLAAATPSKLLPGVKSFAELGLGSFDATSWFGFFGPAGLPAATTDAIHRTVRQVLMEPAVTAKLRGQYMEVLADTPAQFAAANREEYALWKPVIESLGLAKQ